jgi:hypothetical protein
LFKNSFRSSKATINNVATIAGILMALVFSLLLAVGFGAAAYVLTKPGGIAEFIQREAHATVAPDLSAELIFFTIFGFSFLLWATVPLSTGSSRQFDPGNMLLYPISLKKLFALDFVSELITLPSIFALPAILAIGIGAGMGSGKTLRAIAASILAAAFGLALTKWLSVATGSLTRRRRTRGETLVAVIGAVLGIGGAALGQVAPMIFRHAEFVRYFRWTPPGAAAYALSRGLTSNLLFYALAVLALSAYTIVLVVVAYWIARRAALGLDASKRGSIKETKAAASVYTGWELPVVSLSLSAVIEKELRYALRNAQLRMMALMPLILVVIRIANTRRFAAGSNGAPTPENFLYYAQDLMASGGVLYVFLVLSGLSCNLFAFEEAGMRALILAPVDRRKILLGKNVAVAILALAFTAALLLVNQIIFRDLTLHGLLFAVINFLIFGALISVIGNWLSIRFPKRMKFGKRMNVSGVVGLLMIPMIMLLSIPPLAAASAAYLSQSLLIEYATLLTLAAFSVALYALSIGSQGELLQRREIEILEAVQEPND